MYLSFSTADPKNFQFFEYNLLAAGNRTHGMSAVSNSIRFVRNFVKIGYFISGKRDMQTCIQSVW